ncbi:hypothetical protein P3X46_018874 [Hevea brasiliensis]|uniref:Uncharacterized protein n=1 Tax=Hevea brasiliensis TaxID=3981 RepID=A0ABQ9LW17_HEVBR|nr:uncharacterized protein LOC131169427 [Hevea brasiliensis]KAJ9170796.1 hypothetical protein P3X46_018874 [Hevea brasiliensis]
MGSCASSQSQNTTKHHASSPSTIKVIHCDGKLLELKQPTKASYIKTQNPNFFLCSSESMSVGTYVPEVSGEEDLQPGQIFFLLPLSQAHKPLSLPDLCALAAMASSSLGKASKLPLSSVF